jgi:hypothetical protein
LALHLAFYQLQLGVLPFDLAIRSWLRQDGVYPSAILNNSSHEGSQSAGCCIREPRLQIGAVPTSDHGVEPVHEVAGHHERWHCVLNDCRRDHPDLGRGWWAVERNGPIMSRWTDGEAVLALPAMRGTAERRAA